MSAAFKQVIDNIKELTTKERALVAQCLISSLDTKQEQGVDEAWAALAERRLQELESGAVKAVSWQEIKGGLKD